MHLEIFLQSVAGGLYLLGNGEQVRLEELNALSEPLRVAYLAEQASLNKELEETGEAIMESDYGTETMKTLQAQKDAINAKINTLRDTYAASDAAKADKKRAAENAKKLAAIKAELAELAGKIKDVTVDIKNGALAAAKKVADAFHDWLNPEKPEIPQAVTDQAQIAYNAVIKGYGIGAEQK